MRVEALNRGVADGCGAARGDAAGFVGIDAVVADGLLSFH